MILNRISAIRQSFSLKSLFKTIQLKYLSTVQKSDPKVKEIKKYVLNQNKLDTKSDDLKKPVLIYANEKSDFFRRLFFLNFLQLSFWLFLATQTFTLIVKRPKSSTEAELKEKLGSVNTPFEAVKILWKENKNQMIIAIALLICGQLSMSLFTLFTIRSIRYIQLTPSGLNARITTFSLIGSPNRYRNLDIPVDNISAFQTRTSGVNYIPLKIKGKWFYYLVDSKGQFLKPSLFDQTVGVFRILK